MKLAPICEMQMHYTWIDYVDYGVNTLARSRAP